MNLSKLFEMQKKLGQVGLFDYRGEDRFDKLILALLVEVGECANEWRGFKFWSSDQTPRTIKEIKPIQFGIVDGVRKVVDEGEFTNPLLEEFVDGFHFVLEIGIEINREYPTVNRFRKEKTIESQFKKVFNAVLCVETSRMFYLELLEDYLTLGEMLGFTWEEIEQAYLKKNEVNHQRQANGY